DRLAHPGEQGDVPHRAVRHAQRPLLPGDDALTEAEIDQQIVLLGAEEGAGLEDGSGSQHLPEARRAPAEGFVLFGMNQPAFRRKSSHFFYLLLFCPPVWTDVRGVHLCAPPRGGHSAPPLLDFAGGLLSSPQKDSPIELEGKLAICTSLRARGCRGDFSPA